MVHNSDNFLHFLSQLCTFPVTFSYSDALVWYRYVVTIPYSFRKTHQHYTSYTTYNRQKLLILINNNNNKKRKIIGTTIKTLLDMIENVIKKDTVCRNRQPPRPLRLACIPIQVLVLYVFSVIMTAGGSLPMPNWNTTWPSLNSIDV